MSKGERRRIDTQEFMRLMSTGETKDAADAIKLVFLPAKAICRAACRVSRISNEHDQEDVFQQTLLDLVRSAWKTFDGRCSLSTYIYGIATRRCADFYRKRGRGLPEAPASQDKADSSSEYDPARDQVDERKASFEQRVCAQMAIQELERVDPRGARALRTYVEEELSHEELARLLGVTLASLGNLVSRLRRELRRLCEEHCGSSDCTAVVTR